MSRIVTWIVVPALLAGLACTTSPNDKPLVPDDHTDPKGGAFHKSGAENPFETAGNCASATCHHADLRGGWALVPDPPGFDIEHLAPSCYQCHGVKWNDTRPLALRVLYPTSDVVWRHGQSRVIEHWARGLPRRTIQLLAGDTVVATLTASTPAAEVFRVPEVEAAWGTGTDFRIRVTADTGASGTGNAFSICASDDILVSRPRAGAVFAAGDEITVEWTCASGVAVDIDVIRDGVRVGAFRDAAGNNGIHSRVVPGEWGAGVGFRVRVEDHERTIGLSPSFEIVP